MFNAINMCKGKRHIHVLSKEHIQTDFIKHVFLLDLFMRLSLKVIKHVYCIKRAFKMEIIHYFKDIIHNVYYYYTKSF